MAHILAPKRQSWVHVAEGEVTLNGETLRGGDGAVLITESDIKLSAHAPSQVLLFDLN